MDRTRTALWGKRPWSPSTPGQAISDQIGKLADYFELLSDTRRGTLPDFSHAPKFNDFVWNNGNVPLSLQRWELLQDASQVPAATAPPRQP